MTLPTSHRFLRNSLLLASFRCPVWHNPFSLPVVHFNSSVTGAGILSSSPVTPTSIMHFSRYYFGSLMPHAGSILLRNLSSAILIANRLTYLFRHLDWQSTVACHELIRIGIDLLSRIRVIVRIPKRQRDTHNELYLDLFFVGRVQQKESIGSFVRSIYFCHNA